MSVALAIDFPGSADLVTSLPGVATMPGFSIYSGYLTIDAQTGKNFFYMFVQALNDSGNAPIVRWFNGGPGCSSVGGEERKRSNVLVLNLNNKVACLRSLDLSFQTGTAIWSPTRIAGIDWRTCCKLALLVDGSNSFGLSASSSRLQESVHPFAGCVSSFYPRLSGFSFSKTLSDYTSSDQSTAGLWFLVVLVFLSQQCYSG